MRLLRDIYLIVVALACVACGTEPDTVKPLPGDNAPFKVEFDNITRSSVTLSVTPRDLEADYLCVVEEKGVVEEFTKDEYLVATIMQEFADEASNVGKTLSDYMPEVLDRGIMEDVKFSGLKIDADYYVVVFAVDAAKDYRPCGEIVKVPFSTLAVEHDDATFDVVTDVVDNNVSFAVTPSDKELDWYLFTVTKEQYDFYVVAEDGYNMSQSVFYEYYFQQEINSLLGAGYSEQQVVDALIHRGVVSLEAKGLRANTEYYYLIAGMILDSEGIVITTDITKGSYTTKDATQSAMTFEIEVWDVKQLSANVRITPSNDVDQYCALIQPWDGVTPAQEMMHNIVNQWGGWMDIMANDRGVVEHVGANAFRLPAADTDYYVIAFGYKGGITTDAYMKTFRTLPGGSVEEVEFSIAVSAISPYGFTMSITSNDPTIYFAPGACVAENYNEELFIQEQDEVFDYIFEQSADFNPSITVAEVLDQYYYNDKASVAVSGLLPDMEIMAYIYALDVHTGHVVKCFTYDAVARTSTLGVAEPQVELFGYFSGDDEAGSIFNDAAMTKGKAITVVKYTNLENVRTLFTTMVEGDCSNLVAYPDTDLWTLTSGFWKTCNVAEPYLLSC